MQIPDFDYIPLPYLLEIEKRYREKIWEDQLKAFHEYYDTCGDKYYVDINSRFFTPEQLEETVKRIVAHIGPFTAIELKRVISTLNKEGGFDGISRVDNCRLTRRSDELRQDVQGIYRDPSKLHKEEQEEIRLHRNCR